MLVLETCRDKPYEVTDSAGDCQPIGLTGFPQKHAFQARSKVRLPDAPNAYFSARADAEVIDSSKDPNEVLANAAKTLRGHRPRI